MIYISNMKIVMYLNISRMELDYSKTIRMELSLGPCRYFERTYHVNIFVHGQQPLVC